MIPKIRNKALPIGAKGDFNVWLQLLHLETHLQFMGPPGSGKTRLLLWFFECLIMLRKATVILINCKGALGRMARDWVIAAGQIRRLWWFEPGGEYVLGYNPLRPNDLPATTHAKAIREAIRAAWGQASFNSTPQLARILYLVLGISRALGLSLYDCVLMLRPGRPGASFRAAILERLRDPFLRDALLWFVTLSERRQEEIGASTLARLEAFVLDPLIYEILTQPTCLDIGQVIADHNILIINLEIGRPTRLDDVVLLGRFIINDILGQCFSRGGGDPVYLLIDECQNFVSADFALSLDMGRELGLHCILAHQNLGQLKVDE